MTPDFASMDPVFTGNINNFDISPAAQEDFFGFRFYGEISIYQEGSYNFYTSSDDGSMLYINGTLVVDNDGAHATVEQGGVIQLDSGRHQIEVLFFEKAGGAVLEVHYEGPGIPKGAIPDSILGTYIVGGDLVALEGISLPETMTIALGTEILVPVEFMPENASDQAVTFESSDPAVAPVDRYGKLWGLSTGTTTVTATSRDGGFSDATLVTVVNDAPQVTILAPANGAVFADTVPVRVEFTAEDTIGGITTLMLYLNDALEQSLDTLVDRFDLDPLAEGTYVLYVKAEDAYGATGQSGTVTITVEHLTVSADGLDAEEPGIETVPNPFGDIVQFRITLREEGVLTLKVYDLAGTLHHISGPYNLKAGSTVIHWDGAGGNNQVLPSGAYLCRFGMVCGEEQFQVHRMVIKK